MWYITYGHWHSFAFARIHISAGYLHLTYQWFLRSRIGVCYENGNYHDISISRVYFDVSKTFYIYGFSMTVLKSLNSMYIRVRYKGIAVCKCNWYIYIQYIWYTYTYTQYVVVILFASMWFSWYFQGNIHIHHPATQATPRCFHWILRSLQRDMSTHYWMQRCGVWPLWSMRGAVSFVEFCVFPFFFGLVLGARGWLVTFLKNQQQGV